MIVDFDPIAIGQRLREVRGDMSQGAFALKMKVTQHTISNYETGKRLPDVAFLVSIINEYPDADPTWLVTGRRISESGGDNANLMLLKDFRGVLDSTIANLEKGKG